MHAPRQAKRVAKTVVAATPDGSRLMGGVRSVSGTAELSRSRTQHPLDNPSTPLFPLAAARRDARDLVNGPGQALDEPTQRFFSSRLNHDFSSVRVHTDERAAKSAELLSAHAYTVGPHVVFGRGQFAPTTANGRQLLGHELAHVVQQSRGGSAMPGAANRGGEDAADHAANLAARGERAIVAGSRAIGIACKSIFEEFTGGAYAPGLLLEALKYTRPVGTIIDDVNSLGATDRAQALKDIIEERAKRDARQTDLTAKRAKQADPRLQGVLDPELHENGRVLARIDFVLSTLIRGKPIPGWNFTPEDFVNLQRGKRTLTFAPDSGWFPPPLRENLRKTLELVLDPARTTSATEGVNAVDFFHGHLVVKKDRATDKEVKAALAQGKAADESLKAARKKEFGKVSAGRGNPITTPAAITKYDRILAGVVPTFTNVLASTAKLPGAAVMYHTLEFDSPADLKAQGKKRNNDDPRRHYVTPLDSNTPQQYTPPTGATYEKEYTHISEFTFQIDAQGAIHVRPFDGSTTIPTLELSTITGQTYPDVLYFER